jgi:hypothetical protein
MNRLTLTLVLFPVIGTTLMGIFVITILSIDMHAPWEQIALAALGGFVIALPISWFIGRQVLARPRG